MSQPLRVAFADPHLGIIFGSDRNVVLAAGKGTPAAMSLPAAGYDPGAVYLDLTNSTVYHNTGTAAVAVWTALSDGGGTVGGANTWTGANTFTGGLIVTTTNVTITDVNIALSATTGTKIGTATTQKLGFFNATPVAQPATTGTTTGFTVVGSSAVVAPESTFTGNIGATAYTIGDVVNALKKLGLLAA
jgi:hypothetical protein